MRENGSLIRNGRIRQFTGKAAMCQTALPEKRFLFETHWGRLGKNVPQAFFCRSNNVLFVREAGSRLPAECAPSRWGPVPPSSTGPPVACPVPIERRGNVFLPRSASPRQKQEQGQSQSNRCVSRFSVLFQAITPPRKRCFVCRCRHSRPFLFSRPGHSPVFSLYCQTTGWSTVFRQKFRPSSRFLDKPSGMG